MGRFLLVAALVMALALVATCSPDQGSRGSGPGETAAEEETSTQEGGTTDAGPATRPSLKNAPEPGTSPRLGQEFAVEQGQVVSLEDEGLRVLFDSLVSDSRCPSDVQCIWEGYAKIVVRLDKDGEYAGFVELDTSSPRREAHSSRKDYLDYTIELVRLAPYPRTAGDKDEEYVATLLITKDR